MAQKPRKAKTKPVTPDEAKRRHDLMDEAIVEFQGSLDELEGALGMFMIGRHFGWKVLYLIHSKRTVAKYEAILKIKVRDEFPETTPDSERSNGFKAVQAISNFWKVVSGEAKLDIDRETRRSVS